MVRPFSFCYSGVVFLSLLLTMPLDHGHKTAGLRSFFA
ncbi:hypothetical protein PLUTE_a4992 [Pseudoalteromonas luteoviolacea DSM 6061]|nr:hypothetical protein [Pseudoalteromonas luteoviolacea DSM 6061]